MAGDDFVMVQLTEAGVAFADGCTLRINQGRRAFAFEAGVPVRVERSFEWFSILRHQFTPDGNPIFELVTAPVAATPTLVSTQENR